jgi:putative glutathione S-transferase
LTGCNRIERFAFMSNESLMSNEQEDNGEFVRQDDEFRGNIAPEDAQPGRYHLYVSLACPWAHRTLIIRKLLGLEEVISASVVDPIRDHKGWRFGEGEGFGPDPVNGFTYLSEAYFASNPSFTGRVTVPVLWDKEKKVIVNNSEDDICPIFQRVFAGSDAPDFFPAHLEKEQAELSEFIYEKVNNGVYRAGFATSQSAYEDAVNVLFEALEVLEFRLGQNRYLFGDQIVETDWRLFCTLLRFDPVYVGHFKCNLKRISDYPNLSGFLSELYQLPGIAATVNFDHIKRHYYVTHDDINPNQIVPVGPLMDLNTSHVRGV